jgi:hypothetical protein
MITRIGMLTGPAGLLTGVIGQVVQAGPAAELDGTDATGNRRNGCQAAVLPSISTRSAHRRPARGRARYCQVWLTTNACWLMELSV